MSTIIHVSDFARMQAARAAVVCRAEVTGATPGQRTRATSVLYREMQRGRSAATALSLALRQLRPATGHNHDGGAV
ncbi:MAG TPA: hypothetical protein PLJ16_02925 [Casimicrobium huifangae]|nr:hypothetical protein [Casimicrobium huifangae]